MIIMHDLSHANSTIMDTCQQLTRLQIEFADRMHEDWSASIDQPLSTERASKPWIGFLPTLHYPSIIGSIM